MKLIFPHNKYLLTYGSLFAVFLVSTFCFFIRGVSAHESDKENVFIIHVSETGFKPKKSHVDVNTKVVFENVGKEEHWPATDDHPSHTLYDGTSLEEHCTSGATPAFDACKSLKNGETWSFVFTKEGVYRYHDHVWPQFNGEVVVGNPKENVLQKKESVFSYLVYFLRKTFFIISSLFITHEEVTGLESGNTHDEFYINLKKRFEKIVIESNPRDAIGVLQEESAKDQKTLAFCHDVLHVIGRTAFGKYGSFKEAVMYQSDFCNSGYIHGLFESYFNSVDDPLDGLSKQCDTIGTGKRPFDLWQCHHGIGHGLMYFTGGDLDASLKLCEDRLYTPDAVSSCQNGVYMEVFNLEILAKEKDFVDPNNPFLTCTSRKSNKGDCYLYIPVYISQTLNKNFVDIFEECNKAEFGYTYVCIRGVGSEAMKRNMSNPGDVFGLCQQSGSYIDQAACISGMVSMYTNQKGSAVVGKELCESAPEFYQDMCYQTIAQREAFFR